MDTYSVSLLLKRGQTSKRGKETSRTARKLMQHLLVQLPEMLDLPLNIHDIIHVRQEKKLQGIMNYVKSFSMSYVPSLETLLLHTNYTFSHK